ncbi:Sel1 repeat protein [compost metagenome]
MRFGCLQRLAGLFGLAFYLLYPAGALASDELDALSNLYSDGQYEQALPGLRKFAEQGNIRAQSMLCEAGLRGYGSPADPKPSTYCYEAVEQGGVHATGLLAEALLNSPNSTAENLSLGLELARNGDENGGKLAAYVLGEAYFFGIGVPADASRAIHFYQRAESRGEPRASRRLGFVTFYGIYGIPQNVNEGLALLKRASEGGVSDADYDLGLIYRSGQQGVPADLEAAEAYYIRGAQAGNRRAMYGLYEIYMGTPLKELPNTQEVALKALQDSAEAGYPEAQYEYGRILWLGGPIAVDHQAALAWLQEASRQGHAKAQYFLGSIYMEKDMWNPAEAARAYTPLIRNHPDTDDALVAGSRMAGLILYERVPGTPEDAEALLRRAEASTSPHAVQSAASMRQFIRENPPSRKGSGGNVVEDFLTLLILAALTEQPEKNSTDNSGNDASRWSACDQIRQHCQTMCSSMHNQWELEGSTGHWTCSNDCSNDMKSCTGEY